MATKRDKRPPGKEGVKPREIRRPGQGGGNSGDPIPPECWTFFLVDKEPGTDAPRQGEAVQGAPNSGRIQVLSTLHGPLGYAPAKIAREIIQRLDDTGHRVLNGSVVKAGGKLQVELCL